MDTSQLPASALLPHARHRRDLSAREVERREGAHGEASLERLVLAADDAVIRRLEEAPGQSVGEVQASARKALQSTRRRDLLWRGLSAVTGGIGGTAFMVGLQAVIPQAPFWTTSIVSPMVPLTALIGLPVAVLSFIKFTRVNDEKRQNKTVVHTLQSLAAQAGLAASAQEKWRALTDAQS